MCAGLGWTIGTGNAKKRGKLNAKAEIELRVPDNLQLCRRNFWCRKPWEFQAIKPMLTKAKKAVGVVLVRKANFLFENLGVIRIHKLVDSCQLIARLYVDEAWA